MIPDDHLVHEATVAADYFHANSPDGGRRLAHVKRTAALIPTNHSPLCQAVALMHHTPADATGFPPVITGAVQALRRKPSENLLDHYRRIADNAIATCVYRAHLLDHFRRLADVSGEAHAGVLTDLVDADNWFTRHVTGFQSVINESAARAAGGDGAEYAIPHVAVMPREVLDKLDAIALSAGITTAVAGSHRDSIVAATRRAIDEALHVVSVQIREDLAGLADEQPPANFCEDDYASGYRHAMIDAQQLRSLS